jgi:hypothetical protein
MSVLMLYSNQGNRRSELAAVLTTERRDLTEGADIIQLQHQRQLPNGGGQARAAPRLLPSVPRLCDNSLPGSGLGAWRL